MFDIDHKAGIMASATALSRIVSMESFQPTNGDDIIKAVCTLRDDFPRQLAKTRLAVFELLRLLIADPKVAADLRLQHGESSTFMTDLLKLCQNERDPNCLLVWFDVLRKFLSDYEPSSQIIEEVYNTFKAYFPITLPRASQSGITPEELKQALRSCFTSNYQLAPHTFPFLVGKLDQGEGVTVNVKVDILRTIQACVEEYQSPEQSVSPYVDQVWSSLKYEVRNGEIEDTIFATLEVLKTFARRLAGDHLRDYALGVTRDCVNDLSNAMYTAAAGRLLVSVLSASPAAFVLMASPTITHIKENLRHPKSPSHGQDLLKLLHVVLEARLLLVEAEMTAPERSDFEAIDAIFKTLYAEVYEKLVQRALDFGASIEELQTATQAVQGVGALLGQQSATVESASDSNQLLIPQSKCLEISEVLFSIVTQRTAGDASPRTDASDELVNETIKALQRTVTVIPDAFHPLVKKGLGLLESNDIALVYAYTPILAFVGCSQLPKRTPGYGLKNFLVLAGALYTKLLAAIDTGAGAELSGALIAGLQSAVRHFNDASQTQETDDGVSSWNASWLATITAKYAVLDPDSKDHDGLSGLSLTAIPSTTPAIRSDFLLSSLAITRQLYLRSTKPAATSGLTLSDSLTTSFTQAEAQYLNLLATLAGFVFHEITEAQQLSLGAHKYALHLFHRDHVQVPESASEEASAASLSKISEFGSSEWDWVAFSKVNILSLGILKALRPAVVSKLVSCTNAR
jgi:DNA repair/transcription protein MET18/MMS19